MKKMLRRMMAITLGIMILSQGIYAKDSLSVEPILADTESSIYKLDDITTKVKEQLNLGEDFKLDGSSLSTDDFYVKKVWRLEFETEKVHLQVNADAETGDVIAFEYWGGEEGQVLKYTKDQVRKVAKEYIDENYARLKNQLIEIDNQEGIGKFIPYYDNENHVFVYARNINGQIFAGNNITISISGITGKIRSFRIMWDDSTYTKKSNEISEAQARSIFEKGDAIKLKYINVKSEDETNILTIRPVYYYEMKNTGLLDAISKKFYNAEDIYSYRNNDVYMYDTVKEESAANNKSARGAEMVPEEGVISREKVEQNILEKLSKIVSTENLKVKYSNYEGWYKGIKGKYWSITLENEIDNIYVYATLDAITGDILRIHYNNHSVSPYRTYDVMDDLRAALETGEMSEDAFEMKAKTLLAAGEITKEQYDNRLVASKDKSSKDAIKEEVKEKAENLMKKMFPEISSENYFVEVEQSEDRYNKDNIIVSGIRVINDIKYFDNRFTLEYNSESKEFTSLYFDWFYNIQVEQPKSMLSEAAASKIFYDEVGFDKELVQLMNKEKKENEQLIVPMKELALVYKLNPHYFSYIDAVTGKPLNYYGEDYKDDTKVESFTDIKGNEYEQAIKLMNKMGFLEETNEKFLPGNTLTRKDAIKWIVLTLSRQYRYIPSANRYYNNVSQLSFMDINEDDEYYEYIKRAVQMNIIQDGDFFNKDEEVTLLEITRWIINGMGQKELAKFTDVFSDIEGVSAEDKGYVSLAKYYNIIDDATSINIEQKRGKAVELLNNFINQLEENSLAK